MADLRQTAMNPMTGQVGVPMPARPSLAETALSPLLRAYNAYQAYIGQPFQQAVRGGVRGYFGLPLMSDADPTGREAYRQGEALGYTPGVGAPAGAVRVAAEGMQALPSVAAELATFIGAAAKTWDAASNAKAVQMEKAGASPRDIWSQTGNWRAPDGQWRQEISDIEARFTPDPQARTVENVLSHPELFRAYPELQSMRMTVDPSAQSAYSAALGSLPEEITLGRRASTKTALHELQHPIQEREGFGLGANPDMFEYKFAQTPEQRAAFNAFATLSEKLGGPKDLKPSDLALSGDVYDFTQSINDGLNFNARLPKADWEELRAAAKAAGIKPPKSQDQLWMLGEDLANLLNQETSKAAITPTQQYLRAPGEAEARAVEARAGMTAEQRRAIFPEESYDVPISELIDNRNLPPRR